MRCGGRLMLLLLLVVGGPFGVRGSLRATSPVVGGTNTRQNRPPVEEPVSLRSLHQQMLTILGKLETVSRDVAATRAKTDETSRHVSQLLRYFLKTSCADYVAQDSAVSGGPPGRGASSGTGPVGGPYSRQGSMEGVYAIYPPSGNVKMVKCSHDRRGDPGWTVVLLRTDGKEDFNRTYQEYKNGFGNPDAGEVWIGLNTLYEITQSTPHKLKVELTDFKGMVAVADYAQFSVGDAASHYKLSVGGYHASSTAGDALKDHNNMPFSVKDADNDKDKTNSCSRLFGGDGGWWFNTCYHALGTGRYRRPAHPGLTSVTPEYGGVTWHPFADVKQSLAVFKMMVKPVDS